MTPKALFPEKRAPLPSGFACRAFLFVVALLTAAISIAADEAARRDRVASVIDGDTVVLQDGTHVRLVGINAPERGRGERDAEPLAQAAHNALRQRVAGKLVTLRVGVEAHDRHGRLLAHLFAPDGANVQIELLRRGFASFVAIPPNLAYLDQYREAERAARTDGLGIWSHDYFRPRKADHLNPEELGFRFVEGRVKNVGASRHNVFLDMAPGFTVVIARSHWTRFWGGNAQRLEGTRWRVRGWLAPARRGIRMRIGHPAMMEAL